MIESVSASLNVRIVALARAFDGGAHDVGALTARGALAVGRPPRMVRPVAERFVAAFAGRTRPRQREIVAFLLQAGHTSTGRSGLACIDPACAGWFGAPTRHACKR